MFELTMNNPRSIQGVFEAVAAIIDETEITFDSDGISLTSIDAGRVCLISLKIDKEDFDAYKCDQEQKYHDTKTHALCFMLFAKALCPPQRKQKRRVVEKNAFACAEQVAVQANIDRHIEK